MVSPRLQDVGLFDFHRAEETIERGSHAVERQLDDIIREIETRDTKSGPGQRDRARSKSECTNALQPVAK
jgi:NTE family protein